MTMLNKTRKAQNFVSCSSTHFFPKHILTKVNRLSALVTLPHFTRPKLTSSDRHRSTEIIFKLRTYRHEQIITKEYDQVRITINLMMNLYN